jgi:hypothetical protein
MPTITELVNIPTISDPTNFSAYADDFLANQLPNMVDELNAAFGGLTLISFYPGMYLVIADSAAPSTNSMAVQITSYSGTTLIVNCLGFLGSGTKASWAISQSANLIPQDASVSTLKLVDLAVTAAKLAQLFINDLTTVTFDPAADFVAIADTSDSGNKKKALLPSATTAQAGIAEQLTAAEIRTGTDATRFVGAANLLSAFGFSAYYESPQQTITSAGALTLAHGLTRKPTLTKFVLQCTTAESGFSIGDEVTETLSGYNGTSRGVQIIPDSTSLNVRFGTDATAFYTLRKDTGAVVALTNASWRLVVRAWG